MKIFKNLLLRWTDPIFIVSGLPRSGTSMAMKMLQAGGIKAFTDNIREADEDNPRGYFEYEPVKDLRRMGDRTWLINARGQSLKVIAYLLSGLPADHRYRILFMNRHLDEVIASQEKMLKRRGERLDQDSVRVKELLEHELWRARYWMKNQGNVEVLELDYAQIVKSPVNEVARIQKFVGLEMNRERMAAVVDPSLYRNRAGDVSR